MTNSSARRERWTAIRARAARCSTTKSRSLTASRLLAEIAANSSSSATYCRSSDTRRAGQRARAKGKHVGARVAVLEAAEVAVQHLHVGEPVMGEQHQGPLQMRDQQHQAAIGRGPPQQRGLEIQHAAAQSHSARRAQRRGRWRPGRCASGRCGGARPASPRADGGASPPGCGCPRRWTRPRFAGPSPARRHTQGRRRSPARPPRHDPLARQHAGVGDAPRDVLPHIARSTGTTS